ncbi:MAG: hypothetical protein M1836_007483 [Candelina mexicana]|nr:MAG: hypothetical protein M1836_007483 [Candelina mexicana]
MNINSSSSSSSVPTAVSTLHEGRIPRVTFEAFVGLFYGLAVTVATIRLTLQMKVHGRLYPDDYLLIFAWICLTAGTVLCYARVGILYWKEELGLNPSLGSKYASEHIDINAHIVEHQRLSYSCAALVWTTIFTVKFAYLIFFRRLIEQIRPLIIYWRVIVSITAVSFLLCIVFIYVSCTKWGVEAAVCLQPTHLRPTFGLPIFGIVLDVGTDLLLVSIPIRLLWSVKIKPRQKLILGVFLCLNLFMAITASVRVSGLKFHGAIDEVWFFFWQHIEACVAIAMISLTAFRSAFVASQSSRTRREVAKRAWYSSSVEAVKRNRAQRRRDEEAAQELPNIPSATLTGIRTFIQGAHITGTRHSTYDLTSYS